MNYLSGIAILMFAVSLTRLAAQSAYNLPDHLEWKSYSGFSFAELPELAPGEESANYYQGAVWTKGNFIHWVIADGNKEYCVLRWNAVTGETSRTQKSKSRIRGIAYSWDDDALVVRTARSLDFYDNRTFRLRKQVESENVIHYWRDMTIAGNRFYAISPESDSILVYNLSTGERIKTLSPGREKIQRIFCVRENDGNIRMWLYSSYWGNLLYQMDPETGRILRETKSLVHHRRFFTASEMSFPDEGDTAERPQRGFLGIFDLENGVMRILRNAGRLWINVSDEHQILAGGLAYRFTPLRETIVGSYSITNSGDDLSPAEIVLALPQEETYGQSLTNQTLLKAGTEETDELGNRYFRISIPAIPAGATQTAPFHRADLTRWRVYFNLERIGQDPFPENKPKDTLIKRYLEDGNVFELTNPAVRNFYETHFAELPTPSQRITAIFDYADKVMKNVWDGRSDNVSKIIINKHGGCSEHSFFQVAMLRLSGIPARFNWNHIPQSDTVGYFFNHKHAEAWLPETGWIPLEPLGQAYAPGLGANYHLLFTVNKERGNIYSAGYDRVGNYTGDGRWDRYRQAPIKVIWESIP